MTETLQTPTIETLQKQLAVSKALSENSPINIILADTSLTITYANPSSINTLQKLEHLLPCRAEEIVGKSIDLFHKDPKYQRRILTDPRNLPHRAVIDLGGEKLDLLVSAVYGEQGEYLGPMVTWEVVTQKLRLEEEQRDAANRNAAINKCMAVIEFQLDGTIITANDAFLDTMGYTLAEIKGQHHSIFVDPQLARSAEYKAFWAKMNRGEAEQGQYRRVGKGGKEVWIEAIYSPLIGLDGKPYKVVKYATNVTERLKAEQAAAEKTALVENAPVNIILADTNLVITYLNPSSIKTLRQFEHLLPCPVDQIVGKSIDLFHKKPEYQRKLLASDRNLPHRAVITLGDQKLDLLVSATYDPSGKYMGPMVTWEVITEKLRLQEEAAQKTAIVENVPINIMLANNDGKIIYMNPASQRTLRTIEKSLPIRVDEIVGSSYDLFHKNPAHQRRLLGNPKNLPHSAQIQLGEETLALTASAIYDAQGNYAGPMIAWEVITDRVEAARREKENQQREQRAQEELRRKVDELLRVVRAASQGDLTEEVGFSGTDAVGELASGLSSMLVDLRAMIGQIVESAAQFTEGSRLIAESSQSLAQGAQTQSASVEQMSASIEELTRSIEAVKNNAASADTVARDTSKLAEEGGSAVQKSVEAMELIKTSSEQISEIIQVISEIASQTNLLALNAAIEAARAGEHGLGFAVVADEVRKLAERSSEAAKEISKLIKESTKRVEDGATLSEQTGAALQKIIRGVEATAVKISEIATATVEQAQNAKEVASAIQNISQVTEQAAAGSEELASSSEELGAQAASLRDLVKRFKTEK
jgi:methyl-accepting chemotaxis protein